MPAPAAPAPGEPVALPPALPPAALCASPVAGAAAIAITRMDAAKEILAADILPIGKLPYPFQQRSFPQVPRRNIFSQGQLILPDEADSMVRKLIEFDDDTFDKLKQLGRDRMATIQELADEAFTDVLKKHGIPVDLKDALRKSVALRGAKATRSNKKAARTPS